MSDINGRVTEALEALIASGAESGLQVAAWHRGEQVVDAWAGLADVETGRPVDGDTLFTSFSCTKGVTATAIHLLVERGALAYDEPVAAHWPEFAQRGKQGVTIRHALTHRAGVPQMPEGTTPALMADWEHMCGAIAALEPLWEPGTRTGYHAYTFGWILGEVIRRADGRPINRFTQEEICGPLGLDGIHLGVSGADEGRVARLVDGPRADAPPPPPDALILRAIPPAVGILAAPYNEPAVRRAALPAHGGLMNARSLARLYAALGTGASWTARASCRGSACARPRARRRRTWTSSSGSRCGRRWATSRPGPSRPWARARPPSATRARAGPSASPTRSASSPSSSPKARWWQGRSRGRARRRRSARWCGASWASPTRRRRRAASRAARARWR